MSSDMRNRLRDLCELIAEVIKQGHLDSNDVRPIERFEGAVSIYELDFPDNPNGKITFWVNPNTQKIMQIVVSWNGETFKTVMKFQGGSIRGGEFFIERVRLSHVCEDLF